MTTRKHLKRRVRTRAAITGETYTAALEAIRRQQKDELMTPSPQPIASCSFCGKNDTQVTKLVAGPGVYICNECIDLSAAIIADEQHSNPEASREARARFVDPPAADTLALLPALARAASRLEDDLNRSVERLRGQGVSWAEISGALGLSEAATRDRFDRP